MDPDGYQEQTHLPEDQDLMSSFIKRESALEDFTAHPTNAREEARTRSGDKFLWQMLPTGKTCPGAALGEWKQLHGVP